MKCFGNHLLSESLRWISQCWVLGSLLVQDASLLHESWFKTTINLKSLGTCWFLCEFEFYDLIRTFLDSTFCWYRNPIRIRYFTEIQYNLISIVSAMKHDYHTYVLMSYTRLLSLPALSELLSFSHQTSYQILLTYYWKRVR